MKVLLDACVLYPTVMRQVVLGVAAAGLFRPMWSTRILEEWARAARRLGPDGEAQARAEIALVRADWPGAEMPAYPEIEQRLRLPDPHDLHVLAAAVGSGADILLTLNAADFPRRTLAAEGLARQSPDELLRHLHAEHPDKVAAAVARVHARAEQLSGESWDLRRLLKKARLPRLGKILG